MRLRAILLFSVILSISSAIRGQEPGVIESSGAMPAIFRTSLTDMVADGVKTSVTRSDNIRTQLRKADFVLESNYFLSNLLTSGYVVYNHEINEYLDLVLQTLLADDPLADSVSVYLLKSSRSNAFATHQGVIFITTGLLAQLENEAQLAYILGHEITHITEKHSINYHLESKSKLSKRGSSTRDGFDDHIAQMSNYSQALELEADDEAFERLSNSVYDLNASLTVFDVLQFSYLPFDEIDFKIESFESENFKLLKILYLEEANAINLAADTSDSKSTHPSIGKRVKAMAQKMSSTSTNGKAFVAPKEQFYRIQKICRDQVIRSQLRKQEFVMAYYNAVVMAERFPAEDYYKTAQAKALYGLSKYRNAYKRPNDSPSDSEGSISRYYHFFAKLERKALNLVALRRMRELNANINDPFVSRLIENLTQDLIKIHEFKFSDLKFEPYQAKQLDSAVVEPVNEGDTTKFAKLRRQRKQALLEKAHDDGGWEKRFHYYVFVDEDKTAVKELFKRANTNIDSVISEDDNELTKRQKKEIKRKENHLGISLGLDKVVYVDPSYIVITERNGITIKDTDQKQLEFTEQISTISGAANIEVPVLSSSFFSEESSHELNVLSKLKYVMSEIGDHDDISFKINMIPLEADYASEVAKEMGTPYYCYSGIVSYRGIKNEVGNKLMYSLMTAYLAPFFLTWTLLPDQYTYLYHIVLDVDQGTVVYRNEELINAKLNKGAINSLMYDKMIQIHRK